MTTKAIPVSEKLEFVYTNHRGETAKRRVIFRALSFGTTEYYPELQWLIEAFDLDKEAVRVFALKNIKLDTLVVASKLYAPVLAPAPAKLDVEPFCMKMKAPAVTVRSDLPTYFTWLPTRYQRERAQYNHGSTLEQLNEAGGVTWQELAAILDLRPVSVMRDLQAVNSCITKYPQQGFML